ncbi:MAG: DNA polymerase III subunit chi [Acetobacteraceae bacterium]|nr:DNA polymerase III subunit chi [Acetobacteraceae bacterium]
MRIDFYHLTATPLERVLPSIAERLLAGGERLLVVARPEQVEVLNQSLWTYAEESFLPHGARGGGRDGDQPVLIGSEVEPANGARNIALADGTWRDDALGFERAFYFFDSGTIEGARGAWRDLKGRGEAELHYWKQDGRGRWVEGP